MFGNARWTSMGGVLVSLVLFAGCNEDLKKQNGLLQQDNSRLAQELDDCRSQLQSAGQGDAACQQQLEAMRRENQNLASQLQDCLNRPLPQPAQQPVAEGWTAVPGGAMIALEGDVLFGSGKAILRDEAKPVLQKIAAQIKSNYASDDIIIYGHTDADPIKKSGWKDNYELSAQRALSVVRYMMSQGVSGTQLVAGGCGEHRPRGTNATAQGKQQNRRVEVYALNTRSIAPQR